MNTFALFFVNHILYFLPETRFFGFKRLLFILAGAEIGQNVRICSSARIYGNGKLVIGNNTWIGHHTLIICTEYIKIGENVDIAPKVYLGTGTHIVEKNKSKGIAGEGISKPIRVSNGCWLGVGSIILPGVNIGERTIVAAGSVVTKNFGSELVIAGVPAIVKKR